jgi:hypothetical protein
MTPEKLPPASGFLSLDFWLSALTVICTFVLKQFGISAQWLQSLPGGSSWLPILIIVIICLYMVINTYRKTRRARAEQSLPVSSEIEVKTRGLLQTSEFWLGLVVVAIKVLQENNVVGASISDSVTTTFLILAIVYALTRSQLKLVYMRSLLCKVTRVVPFKVKD